MSILFGDRGNRRIVPVTADNQINWHVKFLLKVELTTQSRPDGAGLRLDIEIEIPAAFAVIQAGTK